MAISTENTYLIYKNTASSGTPAAWTKLCDIKEFPDLGSAPTAIDTTTLSNHMKTSVPGLVDPGNLEFNANYDETDFTKLKGIEGKTGYKFGIQFGKGGTGDKNGVYIFDGVLACWIKGGGVEESVDMGISIAPSTEIVAGSASDYVTIS